MNKPQYKYACILLFGVGYSILSFAVPELNVFIWLTRILFAIFSIITMGAFGTLSGHPTTATIIAALSLSFAVNAACGGYLGFLLHKFVLCKYYPIKIDQ